MLPRLYSKRKGNIVPKDAVYIGRPSPWRNPFEEGKDGDRNEVVSKFRSYLQSNPELVEEMKKELIGKDLVCWCVPKLCHGHVILEFLYKEGD